MVELLVTGGTGMLGSAIQKLVPQNFDAVFVGSKNFDLTNFNETKKMVQKYKPKKIIHLAAKVGGVKANSEKLANFFDENVLINTHVLMAANQYEVQHVLSLLSTCVYPDEGYVTYPLTENQLHNGPPHYSNFAYAYAKRMLEVQSKAYRIQHNRNYICAIPNNIYGINDNFNLEDGHVVPTVVRKIFEAKISKIPPVFWGDGSSLREFTYSKDIAECLLKIIGIFDSPSSEPICNIGSNDEISIGDLVGIVAKIFDYKGEIIWDTSKPAGQYRKPSLATKIKHEYTPVEEGLKITCRWFEKHYPNIRGI